MEASDPITPKRQEELITSRSLEQLGLNFLYAGYDRDTVRWSILRVLTHGLDTLVDAAERLCEQPDLRVTELDAIVALRSSGIAVGSIVAHLLGRPLFWFIEPSEQSLFPRHVALRGARVALFDSHVITGGNLTRHVEVLRWIGATVTSCRVLLDCDRFREPDAADHLLHRAGGVFSLWRTSQLHQVLLERDDTRSSELLAFLDQDSSRAWRGG